jgi:hypothetical protein
MPAPNTKLQLDTNTYQNVQSKILTNPKNWQTHVDGNLNHACLKGDSIHKHTYDKNLTLKWFLKIKEDSV